MIMKNKYLIILSAILIVSCAKKTETRTSKNENVSSYVDPFIKKKKKNHKS